MSSNPNTDTENYSDSDSDGDGNAEPNLENLAARVHGLEVEVYGYDPQRPAGEEVVVDIKRTIVFLEARFETRGEYSGVPLEAVYDVAEVIGVDRDLAEQACGRLKRMGEIYQPASDEVRTP